MHCTEILSREHRVILRVLVCLDRVLSACETAGRLEREDAGQILAFFKGFADSWHHAKEEQCLFPKLVELGLPEDSGPVRVMLDEHDLGRGLVGSLSTSLEGAAEGRAEDVATFLASGRQYLELLRDHIAKEDHVLFPMAQGFLTPEADQAVRAAFEAVEQEHAECGEMSGTVDALCERLGVDAAQVEELAATARGGCSGAHRTRKG